MGAASAIFLVIITIFLPPLGVYAVAGCGADLLINILLTFLGYLPGHVHAFYIEYVYYERKERAREGQFNLAPAPGIFSNKVQNAGMGGGYGTMPAHGEY